MARREMGAWLMITSVAAGLTLYSAGIALWVFDTRHDLPIHMSIAMLFVAVVSIFFGALLPLAACAWSNPWWSYHKVAGGFGMSLFLAFFAVIIWGQQPRWFAYTYALIACLSCWAGYIDFIEVRRAGIAAKAQNDAASSRADSK